jgi:hypothetical protein
MTISKTHKLIPFPKLFKLLFGIAVVVQLIVISTTHISGYAVLNDTLHFITRFIFGTTLSLIALFIVTYPNLSIIRFLNRSFPWEESTFLRISIEVVLSVLLAIIMAFLLTLFSDLLNPYKEGLWLNLIYNASIFAVCNLILMIILEGWIFFIEGSQSRIKSEKLEDQVSQLRFEILKSQIDSHFMFNSLNVLSGLIETDQEKAQQFINEFSRIYRYVMESIEKPVVTVKKEMQFARSYMILQQMRYGEHLNFQVDLPTYVLNAYVPPLSLQVVLENVCKHNVINAEKPLQIHLTANENVLVITNNLQLKLSSGNGSGTGQKNLQKRYELLGYETPEFRVGTSTYTVTLPLIYEEY